MNLPEDRMPEAEVALRLAEYLIALPGVADDVSVAIDGAGVTSHGKEVFPMADYLAAYGWVQQEQKGRNPWAGVYARAGKRLTVHSRSGVGDVVTQWQGRRVVAECKKGPLIHRRGNPERGHLCGVIGQAVLHDAKADDVVLVAVPDSPAFRRLADQWRKRPLFAKTGIGICLVARSGEVTGFPAAIG